MWLGVQNVLSNPETGLIEWFSEARGLSVPDLWTEREMTFLPTLID